MNIKHGAARLGQNIPVKSKIRIGIILIINNLSIHRAVY